uniref:Uncharacterized protein n=1 Tax=Vespula pensylvanica TaxID=30213 RepID=A0A834KWF9_VESPE|nr:hypothetical protein H0235_013141 [Vespula pensylvanica]
MDKTRLDLGRRTTFCVKVSNGSFVWEDSRQVSGVARERKTQGHVIVKTVDNNGEILRGRYDFLRARVFRKGLCDRDPFGGDTMTLLRFSSNPVPRAKLSTSVSARATGCRWHAFCRVTR